MGSFIFPHDLPSFRNGTVKLHCFSQCFSVVIFFVWDYSYCHCDFTAQLCINQRNIIQGNIERSTLPLVSVRTAGYQPRHLDLLWFNCGSTRVAVSKKNIWMLALKSHLYFHHQTASINQHVSFKRQSRQHSDRRDNKVM